ncbi:MAG: hypothetical protein CSA82_01450, partial [Actinobacteria bacterium]
SATPVLYPLHTLYLLSNTPTTTKTPRETTRLTALRTYLATPTPFAVIDYDNNGTLEGTATMARYLTGHRTSSGHNFMGFQDAGEAYGAMINDAVRLSDDIPPSPDPDAFPSGEANPTYQEQRVARNKWRSDDERRIAIAGYFAVGYQDGLDADHSSFLLPYDKIDGQDVFGYVNFRLRSWLGPILLPHVKSLGESMSDTTSLNEAVSVFSFSDTHGELSISHYMLHRMLASDGLFADLAFDTPTVIDEGDPGDPFDNTYAGGRPPALTLLRVAAYEGHVRDITQVLHDYAGEGLGSTEYDWAYATNLFFLPRKGKNPSLKKALSFHNDMWQDTILDALESTPNDELARGKYSQILLDQPLQPGTIPLSSAGQIPEGVPQSGDIANKQYPDVEQDMRFALYKALCTNTVWEVPYEENTFVDFAKLREETSYGSLFTVSDGTLIPYEKLDQEGKGAFEYFVREDMRFYEVFDDLETVNLIARKEVVEISEVEEERPFPSSDFTFEMLRCSFPVPGCTPPQ